MKEKRKRILTSGMIAVALVLAGLVLGCGDYKYPESNAKDIENTGFVIYTTD